MFTKSFEVLRHVYDSLMGERSPDKTSSTVLEASLRHFFPKELTYEVSNYHQRMSLRSLVGLPAIDINYRDNDAILRLKGSISWMSKKKVDVTEIIRDIRDG
jgi:hypothetical protein